jgi:hypothetical protein
MPVKAPREPRTARTRSQRVAAPPTQTKTRRLPPAFTLAWLHLLPHSAFPIRSRDDMAFKISALLLGGQANGTGHRLPVGAPPQPRKKNRPLTSSAYGNNDHGPLVSERLFGSCVRCNPMV